MKRLFKPLLAGLALSAGLAIAASAAADGYQLQVGVQTWTLRNMEFDQVVAFAKKHGITRLQMISKHIDPRGDWEEIKLL